MITSRVRGFASWLQGLLRLALLLCRDILYSAINRYGHTSNAQEGEDMVLRRIFEATDEGVYIDVGSHHPKRFSNTYFFYQQGWRGLNIDAAPRSAVRFRVWRPRDVSVEQAVGDESGEQVFYSFDEPAFNGFYDTAGRELPDGARVTKKSSLFVRRLSDVIDEHLGVEAVIDLLSIDVEGHELSVLKSCDWSRHRPSVIVAEALNTSILDIEGCEVARYLCSVGYVPFAKTVHSVFYAEEQFAKRHPSIVVPSRPRISRP